jgi:NitT/TauT family transport system substrate-binding protein
MSDHHSPAIRRSTLLQGLSALALAGLNPRQASAADALVTVRFAMPPIDGAAVPYYARDLGYFHDAGIEPQIAKVASGSAIATSVIAGDVEIGYSNVLALAQAHEHGLPVKVIFPGSLYQSSSPSTVLVVANNSPIRGPKDLAGKTLGVPGVGTLLQLAPMAWVEAHGGDPKSIRFVEMAPQLIAPAVAAGRLDAGSVSEPYITLNSGKVRILAPGLDGVAPTFVSGAWFVSQAWAGANPRTIVAVIAILKKTAQWANAHHEESGALIAKDLAVDPDVATHMIRSVYPEQLIQSQFQVQIDVAARYNFLQSAFPAADLIFSPR